MSASFVRDPDVCVITCAVTESTQISQTFVLSLRRASDLAEFPAHSVCGRPLHRAARIRARPPMWLIHLTVQFIAIRLMTSARPPSHFSA